MRVAIFQAKHSLQIHTMNLANLLTQNGYAVDIFLFRCNTLAWKHKIVNESDYKNIKFYIYDNKFFINTFFKIINRFQRISGIKLFNSFFNKELILRPVLFHSQKIVSTEKYDFVIGIEKLGLIWAGQVAGKFDLKLVYYSLEIWDESMYNNPNDREFSLLRVLERKYHKSVSLTIVQDELRAKVLKRINEINVMPIVYIPVSLTEEIVMLKSYYLHQALNIEVDKKIILYFGTVAENRLQLNLLEQLAKLDASFVIVLHGYITDAMKLEINTRFQKSKVIISSGFVSESEISKVIASAYIGLALYIGTDENDMLTAFSSEKVTRYCQCGVPFISFNNVSYQNLFSEFNCGIMINNYSEIRNAIGTIDSNYKAYQFKAREAYSKYFYFSNYSEILLKNLSRISKNTETHK